MTAATESSTTISTECTYFQRQKVGRKNSAGSISLQQFHRYLTILQSSGSQNLPKETKKEPKFQSRDKKIHFTTCSVDIDEEKSLFNGKYYNKVHKVEKDDNRISFPAIRPIHGIKNHIDVKHKTVKDRVVLPAITTATSTDNLKTRKPIIVPTASEHLPQVSASSKQTLIKVSNPKESILPNSKLHKLETSTNIKFQLMDNNGDVKSKQGTSTKILLQLNKARLGEPPVPAAEDEITESYEPHVIDLSSDCRPLKPKKRIQPKYKKNNNDKKNPRKVSMSTPVPVVHRFCCIPGPPVPLRLYVSYHEKPKEKYVEGITDGYGRPALPVSKKHLLNGMIYDRVSKSLHPPKPPSLSKKRLKRTASSVRTISAFTKGIVSRPGSKHSEGRSSKVKLSREKSRTLLPIIPSSDE